MHLPCMGLILFQVLAIHTLVFYCQASSFTDQTDKQALLEFQSNLSPNSRVSLASWNESVDLCNWTGVTCARKHKRVTGLNLSGMKLTGVISPFIGNLSFITSHSLAHNSFHGSIPPEVGKLFRLQLEPEKQRSRRWDSTRLIQLFCTFDQWSILQQSWTRDSFRASLTFFSCPSVSP